MSTSQPTSNSPLQLVLLAIAVDRLRTEKTTGWLSSCLVPWDAWAHWCCVILHLTLILQLNHGIKTKRGSAKSCQPSFFHECKADSLVGRRQSVGLIGVVVPAAPWLWVLTADLPGWMRLQQRLEEVLLSQLSYLSAVASRWRVLSILVIQMMLRSSWYCKQVHSSSAYLENLTAARCLTR